MDRDELAQLLSDLRGLRQSVCSGEGRGPVGATWLTHLLALSPDSFSVMDVEGHLLYLSRPVPGVPSDVLGKNVLDFLPAENKAVLRCAMNRVTETGEPENVIFKSAGDYWWETKIAGVKNTGGEVEYLVSVGHDVSARKRAERDLQLAEDQLQVALQAAGMGQWRLDIANDRVTWDSAARTMFGWGKDETPGLGQVLDRVVSEDRERVRQHAEQALSTAIYEDLECRVAHPNGEQRWVLSRGKVQTDGSGKPTALIGAIVDITSQKQRDTSLERSRKLEAVGQLASGVAHDFNNLLVVINGNVELARSTSDFSEREELLAEALEASDRAAKLTKQLLAFASRQVVKEELLDINSVTRDTLDLLRRLLPESIEVSFVAGKGLPLLLGDRGQIEQVLINLCVNARDAMPAGGRLMLTSEAVEIDAAEGPASCGLPLGRYLLLTVTDSGVGIAEAVLSRVFDPFFSTKNHGTGLGLATAYGIVRQHGGLLNAQSNGGHGACFQIYLPATLQRGEEPHPAMRRVAVLGGSETILVAEDEDGVRAIVARVLRSRGYTVILARDGQEAVELFTVHANEIALVILDAIMPRMTGSQAHEEIRRQRPTIPILISSGYPSETTALSDGGAHFLQKPYDPDMLLREVRSALDAGGPETKQTEG